MCALVTMLAAVVASAQPPNGAVPGPVLGIVEIPDMFAVDSEKEGSAPRTALAIYTRPDSDSKVLAVITSPQSIDDAEYGYEEAGALVYGRERGYFLIRTSRGVGWLSPGEAGTFHSLETLIARDETYLTDSWDGFIHASPGSAKRTRIGPQSPPGRVDAAVVRVKGSRHVNGKLWVDVEVLSHSVCVSDQPPTTRVRGWIRGHDATGAPTVWFHSRGC